MTAHDALARSFQRAGPAYDRYRPSFPSAAVDLLVPAHVRSILDLGAGTGKLTELIVDRADQVFAVDPASQMLDVLHRKLPDVVASIGTAEAIPLPDASVDTVVVAQAFHWFDRDAACQDIRRILRSDGSLGLVWNGADPACAWDVACRRIARPPAIVSDHRSETDTTEYDAATITADPDAEERLPGFTMRRKELIRWTEEIRRSDYLRRWHTVSTFLSADAAERARMTLDIEAVLDAESATRGRDLLTLPSRTTVYVYDIARS